MKIDERTECFAERESASSGGNLLVACQAATVSAERTASPDPLVTVSGSMNSFLPERADTGRYERSSL
jgi:hypothetical protein